MVANARSPRDTRQPLPETAPGHETAETDRGRGATDTRAAAPRQRERHCWSFSAENPLMRKVLLARGWVEAAEPACADLVWTVRSTSIAWQAISASTLANHFDRASPLCTKVGLASCMRAGGDSAVFFPRSFDLSVQREVQAFIVDVQLTAACSVLKRIVAEGTPYQAATAGDGNRSCACARARRHASADTGNGVELAASERESGATEDTTRPDVPGPSPLVPLEVGACVADSLAAAAVKHVLEHTRHLIRPLAIAGLDLFAFPPPTAADLAELCCASAHVKRGCDGCGDENDATAAADVSTPMRDRLRQLATRLLVELEAVLPQLYLDGIANVWITKPAFGSKGQGIQLIRGLNALKQVVAQRGAARVVQKYVEVRVGSSSNLPCLRWVGACGAVCGFRGAAGAA